MGQETPGQTREGRLIEEAAKASGRSIRALAANAGMSDTRWRQVIRGWQQSSGDRTIEAKASAHTLARMAIAVGVTPEQLEDVDREDAAEAQRRIVESMKHGSVAPQLAGAPGQTDEIDMIYASKTMSAEQKLRAIRQVLSLRAQLEADHEQHEAPAQDAGAEADRPV